MHEALVSVAKPALPHSAIILAGGRGSRLGHVAKPLVEVGGRTMLEAALVAASSASETVVVGQVPVPSGVGQVVEDPPFGGPAAGVSAGLRALSRNEPWVLVLAADLPAVDQAVPVLLSAAAALGDDIVDGLCFHDRTGHPQWMLALYRTSSLRSAVDAVATTDLSLRRLLAPLTLTTIPGDESTITDCDTWDDVAAARTRSQ